MTVWQPSPADLYDLFNEESGDDIAYYVNHYGRDDTVVELGAGTGRITMPLAREAVCVVAVDNSPVMLARLVAKLAQEEPSVRDHVVVHEGDFRGLTLVGVFDDAFYPYCTFNFLLSPRDQACALRSLRSCLRPGARVVFDLLTAHTFDLPLTSKATFPMAPIEQGPVVVQREYTNHFDASSSILKQHRRFLLSDEGGHTQRYDTEMVNRLVTPKEMRVLLTEEGYRVREVCGDYGGGTYANGSAVLLIEAQVI